MLKVEVIGNLGADAEVKESQGSKFVTFRVAHSEKYTDQQGTEHNVTEWVDCTMNDVESKVLPYLRQGVKVFVRGNARTRVYSSPKDRVMKAGLQISVREVELCGGQSDDVPRQIIDPSNGQVFDVQKYYWINRENKDIKKDEYLPLIDQKGRSYLMNKAGFVSPTQEESTAAEDGTQK